jgi:hypothetical protein
VTASCRLSTRRRSSAGRLEPNSSASCRPSARRVGPRVRAPSLDVQTGCRLTCPLALRRGQAPARRRARRAPARRSPGRHHRGRAGGRGGARRGGSEAVAWCRGRRGDERPSVSGPRPRRSSAASGVDRRCPPRGPWPSRGRRDRPAPRRRARSRRAGAEAPGAPRADRVGDRQAPARARPRDRGVPRTRSRERGPPKASWERIPRRRGRQDGGARSPFDESSRSPATRVWARGSSVWRAGRSRTSFAWRGSAGTYRIRGRWS